MRLGNNFIDLFAEQREKFQKTDLSPRQRVKNAIHRKEIDRTPFDLWISPAIWEKLKSGLNTESEEEIQELLSTDLRIVQPNYVGPAPVDLGNEIFVNEFGSHRVTRSTPYGEYYELKQFPLAEATKVSELENYPYLPKVEDWDPASVTHQISKLDAVDEYYLRFEACGIFEYSWPLFGLENLLLRMGSDDMALPNAAMAYITELFIGLTKQVLNAAEGRYDMVYIYDDIGTQFAPMMSVQMWREYIMPWHKKYLNAIREYGVDIMYHSDGAIYPFIKYLIEDLKIDVLNPMQKTAKGMDFTKIKNNFGDRLSFYGAIDVQEVLPTYTPEAVREEVINVQQILGAGGGYVCTSAHRMQGDVPLENVIAMYTAPRDINQF
ncbi:MAG: uroporphyrinogen decarboxylase family protein [Chloroflexota bacterium]|nr:uroporphyrinogen decarboxylase family protein [Chloroflexota bacterium]